MRWLLLLWFLVAPALAAPGQPLITCPQLGYEDYSLEGHESLDPLFFVGITVCKVQEAEDFPWTAEPGRSGIAFEDYLKGSWVDGRAAGLTISQQCGYNLPDTWIIQSQVWQWDAIYVDGELIVPPHVSSQGASICIYYRATTDLEVYPQGKAYVLNGRITSQECFFTDDFYFTDSVFSSEIVGPAAILTPILSRAEGMRNEHKPCPHPLALNWDMYCLDFPNSSKCGSRDMSTCERWSRDELRSVNGFINNRGLVVDMCQPGATKFDDCNGDCVELIAFTQCFTHPDFWVDNTWRIRDNITPVMVDAIMSSHLRNSATKNCAILDGLLPPEEAPPPPWWCGFFPIACNDNPDPPNGDHCRDKYQSFIDRATCIINGEEPPPDDGSGGDGSGDGGSGGDGSGGDGSGGDGSGGDGSGSGGSGDDGSGGDGTDPPPDPDYCDLYPSSASCGGSSGGGGDGGNDDGGGGGRDCDPDAPPGSEDYCVPPDCDRICQKINEIQNQMSTKFPFAMGSWLNFGASSPASGCQDFQVTMFGATQYAGWCTHPIYGFLRNTMRAFSLTVMLVAMSFGLPRSVSKT